MQDCLFCKFVRKELPAEIVYEDDTVLVFVDIKPNNPGHVLVLPKAHADTFADAPEESIQAIALVAQRMGRAVMKAFGATGFNIGVNNGQTAGQVIYHLHMHVIPRFEGDGLEHWHGKPYQDGEIAEVGQKIRNVLSLG
ncbi:MAG: HIT family protein [Patescibacteria group bacterium]|nr:MAG: HIT family protein [Patescibacteria group bacterium]